MSRFRKTITFDNLYPGSDKLVNALFRHGVIIGDPLTHEVVGVSATGEQPGHLVRLPNYTAAELPVVTRSLPEHLQFYWRLRQRYPNCRVRIIGEGRPHLLLPRELGEAIRAFLAQPASQPIF